MASEYRDNFYLGGACLLLEYGTGHSISAPGGGGGGDGGGGAYGGRSNALDWLCDRCSTANFAR